MKSHAATPVLIFCLALFWGGGADAAESAEWQPFMSVRRPEVPVVRNSFWVANPIDAFIAAEHEKRGLEPRPEAPKVTLMRRAYVDLIGLTPSIEEQRTFLGDDEPGAYERLIERLLADARYGERWGRHWMDVWRYSDWAGWSGGNQIRDSKPHIWRWRDWIVESLNSDKGYDQMLQEMLAADELYPENTNALRATGFLVRNFKMLSREQWLEDTVKHTSQAFLGVTVGCAKCHDHVYDPIPQTDYYRMRAVFEPHQVRTDRVPGEVDTGKDGLVRVYDVGPPAPTYLFVRGDERTPDTNQVVAPGVPAALIAQMADHFATGGVLRVRSVSLPPLASAPDKRPFVIRDLQAASEKAVVAARDRLEELRKAETQDAKKLAEHELQFAVVEAQDRSLKATIKAEQLEEVKGSEEWKAAAQNAAAAQRELAVREASLKMHAAKVALTEAQTKLGVLKAELGLAQETGAAAESGGTAEEKPIADAKQKERIEKAEKAVTEAGKKLEEVEKARESALVLAKDKSATEYKPRTMELYPGESSGRRRAFAQWLTDRRNPLTARVAVNHIWLRHFGRGLVPTPANFGRNGGLPSHPQLLDWLAAELMAADWSMKQIHRLIMTSSAYRMASTPNEANLAADPDNVFLWRMSSRRMEAEIVRDNLLWAAGELDFTMGGPEIDHKHGLSSKRRSVYLRIAAEKEVEFLKIFDGPNVTECYERRSTVVPQQALALANSELAITQAGNLARRLGAEALALGVLPGEATDQIIVERAFLRLLGREPTPQEMRLCMEFLRQRVAESGENIRKVDATGSTYGADDVVQRARQNLMLVLLNHNDFVTVR